MAVDRERVWRVVGDKGLSPGSFADEPGLLGLLEDAEGSEIESKGCEGSEKLFVKGIGI